MVKVRMLTSVAGRDISWSAGEVVDMTKDQADVWADGVRAVRVDGRRVETTAVRPAEAAVDRQPVEAAVVRPREDRARARRRTR